MRLAGYHNLCRIPKTRSLPYLWDERRLWSNLTKVRDGTGQVFDKAEDWKRHLIPS